MQPAARRLHLAVQARGARRQRSRVRRHVSSSICAADSTSSGRARFGLEVGALSAEEGVAAAVEATAVEARACGEGSSGRSAAEAEGSNDAVESRELDEGDCGTSPSPRLVGVCAVCVCGAFVGVR